MNNRLNMPDDMTSLDAWLDRATPQERALAAGDSTVGEDVRAAIRAQMALDEAMRRKFAPPATPIPLTHAVAEPHEQAIEDALRRRFAPPPETGALPLAGDAGRAPESSKAKASASTPLRRWAPLAAAAIVLITLGVLALRLLLPGDAPAIRGPVIAMDVQYRNEVASGFNPYWICRTSEEFTRRFKSRFGHKLTMADPPKGVKAEGMDYVNAISPKTVCVLGRVQDQPVMVFVDLAANDRQRPPLTDPELHLFNRTVGPYVLYELTPLDAPAMLDLFSAPGA